MAPPQEILDLVEHFERNIADFRSTRYNETELRREFLDPFFAALGWDVNNHLRYSETYKDVVHEPARETDQGIPDYCFRIGGTPKFYVEAKKPGVRLKDNPEPALQLRRYAWSSKLPLSVLSSFDELAIYDCRTAPKPSDKASHARIAYYGFQEYPAKWDEIASRFSKDAVLQGSFDRYVDSSKAKRGTAEVDKTFLTDIESWRHELAASIAVRNPTLGQREVNFAVQRTIDRIIFLRICEDRGLESYGQLRELTEHSNIYQQLCGLFRKADERYNSGLFHFHKDKERAEEPDTITPTLKVDDARLKPILKRLYYPESPYAFSRVPADILGQVYEQFLGHVIRITPARQVKVEPKPEVKKAGGVYYTPTYIVDYIVKSTVGKLLDGKSPKQAAKIRVLDPACGSGSFLIGAYQHLLNWYRDCYVEEGPQRKKSEIVRDDGGNWRLTLDEKKRILTRHIYGVDVDSQAVEVTKLSLLLKVLEGESQLKLFHERALPDLGKNIKCGNSLIGPDFYLNQQMFLLDEDERYRINVFDWNEGFPEIMTDGGFDAVIGNPPYVRAESLKELKPYFERSYAANNTSADLYVFFMERGLSLLRANCPLSFIVSSSFLRTTYATEIREFLAKHSRIIRLVDFGGLPVFANAKDTYVCIPLLKKESPGNTVQVCKVPTLSNLNLDELVSSQSYAAPISQFTRDSWSLASREERETFEKIVNAGKPLGEVVAGRIYYGIKTGLNEAFEIDGAKRKEMLGRCPAAAKVIHPFFGGQNIRRYYLEGSERFLIAIPSGWTTQQLISNGGIVSSISERTAWNWLSNNFRALTDHLAPFRDAAKARQDSGEFWWELRACDYYPVFSEAKIIYPDITKGPRFVLDRSGAYLSNTGSVLGSDDLYLLAVLNSKLAWFAISCISIPFGVRAGEFRYRLIYQYMEQLPIRILSQSASDIFARNTAVKLANQIIQLHVQYEGSRTDHERTVIARQIEATDKQIDKLVYELYGLTDKEIAIVESSVHHTQAVTASADA